MKVELYSELAHLRGQQISVLEIIIGLNKKTKTLEDKITRIQKKIDVEDEKDLGQKKA
jgi:transcriptional accessory protein Tex/SPT6